MSWFVTDLKAILIRFRCNKKCYLFFKVDKLISEYAYSWSEDRSSINYNCSEEYRERRKVYNNGWMCLFYREDDRINKSRKERFIIYKSGEYNLCFW